MPFIHLFCGKTQATGPEMFKAGPGISVLMQATLILLAIFARWQIVTSGAITFNMSSLKMPDSYAPAPG